MENHFEYYTLKLKTLSPLFIGGGAKVGKKEFCFVSDNFSRKEKIVFVDMNQLIEYLVQKDSVSFSAGKKSRTEKFEEFMLSSNKKQLYDFVQDIRMSVTDFRKITLYEIDNGGRFDNAHSMSEILCFMRNENFSAYVPGSSVKGMLRTIILQYLIRHNKEYAEDLLRREQEKKGYGKQQLSRDKISAVDNGFINSLSIKKKNGVPTKNNALNSIMKGLIVSDSSVIDNDNFIISGKNDIPVSGQKYEKKLNTARECIRPGVQIEFAVKIDKRYFKPMGVSEHFDEFLKKAIDEFDKEYTELYMKKFVSYQNEEVNAKNFSKPFVILGGGSGYFSKNIAYTLYDYDTALTMVTEYMDKEFKKHNHKNDTAIGISPHMIKATKYRGQYFHFGLCEADIVRNDKV